MSKLFDSFTDEEKNEIQQALHYKRIPEDKKELREILLSELRVDDKNQWLLKEIVEEKKMQLSVEQRETLQKLISRKRSVSFSSVTLYDCIRSDGLALNIDNVDIDAPTLHIPLDFPTPVPSDFLCEHLARIFEVWVLDNEKACRIIIDAILLEALFSDFNNSLYGFCDVKNDWEGTGFGFTGNVDYMFGSSKKRTVRSMDSFLLVVEAKIEWPKSAIPQVLAEAGCLLRRRLAAGKNTPVFAVLTNGTDFRFFAVDTDGVVYASEKEVLKLGEDGTYKSSTSLSEILRWFNWLMTALSPRAHSEDLTVEMIEDSLTRLRNCFGRKSSISSKKMKIQK